MKYRCRKHLFRLALLVFACLPVTVLHAKEGKSSTVISTPPQDDLQIAQPLKDLKRVPQENVDKSSTVMSTPPYVELLIAQPPKDWKKVFEANLGDIRVTDYVPEGESKDHWTAKLSFESYTSLLKSDPLLVIKSQVDADKKHCNFVKDFTLFSGEENNYETAMKLITCGKKKSTGKGEVSLFKAIKGTRYFYVVKLVRVLPSFDPGKSKFGRRDMASWSHYFSKIRVCDPGSKDHPCPKPAKH